MVLYGKLMHDNAYTARMIMRSVLAKKIWKKFPILVHKCMYTLADDNYWKWSLVRLLRLIFIDIKNIIVLEVIDNNSIIWIVFNIDDADTIN